MEDMSYERLLRLDEGNMQRQSLPARVVDKFRWVTVVSTDAASCECSICLEDLRGVVRPRRHRAKLTLYHHTHSVFQASQLSA